MKRQIIFYVEFESNLEDINTGIIWFDWDGKSPVMTSAFDALSDYMKEKYPNEEYHVKDWEWTDRR